jgi:hypothetical protein
MLRPHNKKPGFYVRQHEGGSMTSITGTQPMQTERLDHALASTVIQSWDELMPKSTSGLIQIEYQTGDDGSIEFLMIWASTIRGHWKLVCELWMRPLWSHATGLRFSNDYHSAAFAHTLELVMGNENAFSKLADQHGLIQVYPPTQEERKEADHWTSVAFDQLASVPVEHYGSGSAETAIAA